MEHVGQHRLTGLFPAVRLYDYNFLMNTRAGKVITGEEDARITNSLGSGLSKDRVWDNDNGSTLPLIQLRGIVVSSKSDYITGSLIGQRKYVQYLFDQLL